MSNPISTKDKLLKAATELFWTRGYSNVSVRDITRSASVDAALVSRYFGGKQGLFEATLEQVPTWDALAVDRENLLARLVEVFSQPYDPRTDATNPFTLLLTNVTDPEMGDKIREIVRHNLSEPLAKEIGGKQAEERTAMLLAVLFGVALMRKGFQIEGIADKATEDLNMQLNHLGQAALDFSS